MKPEIISKIKAPTKQSPFLIKYEKKGEKIKRIVLTYDEDEVDLQELRIRLAGEKDNLEKARKRVERMEKLIQEMEEIQPQISE